MSELREEFEKEVGLIYSIYDYVEWLEEKAQWIHIEDEEPPKDKP